MKTILLIVWPCFAFLFGACARETAVTTTTTTTTITTTTTDEDDMITRYKDSFTQRDTVPGASDSLAAIWGEEMTSILKDAERIEAFHLKEWALDTTDAHFHGFEIIGDAKTLNQLQRENLKTIIFNNQSYVRDSLNKRCEFYPNIGFRFHKADQVVSVMVALNCDIIAIQNMQSALPDFKEDFDPAHQEITLFSNTIFPNVFDGYLQNPTNVAPRTGN